MNFSQYTSELATHMSQISPSSIPGALWRSYLEYLWFYEPDSWVARIAYAARVIAFLVVLPLVVFALLVSLLFFGCNYFRNDKHHRIYHHTLLLAPLASLTMSRLQRATRRLSILPTRLQSEWRTQAPYRQTRCSASIPITTFLRITTHTTKYAAHSPTPCLHQANRSPYFMPVEKTTTPKFQAWTCSLLQPRNRLRLQSPVSSCPSKASCQEKKLFGIGGRTPARVKPFLFPSTISFGSHYYYDTNSLYALYVRCTIQELNKSRV